MTNALECAKLNEESEMICRWCMNTVRSMWNWYDHANTRPIPCCPNEIEKFHVNLFKSISNKLLQFSPPIRSMTIATLDKTFPRVIWIRFAARETSFFHPLDISAGLVNLDAIFAWPLFSHRVRMSVILIHDTHTNDTATRQAHRQPAQEVDKRNANYTVIFINHRVHMENGIWAINKLETLNVNRMNMVIIIIVCLRL